jgi:hypothetical protein
MLPDDPPKPVMVNTGITVEQGVLDKLEEIVASEKVKSRNRLMGSFLKFAVELFPQLKALDSQIEAVKKAEDCTRAEAIGLLVRRGLATYDKKAKK